MKKFLSKFRKNKDGVVSVEFALIAPMLIFATLFSINLGYSVNKHQKLASSLAAGSNYMQDYLLENELDNVRPNWDNETGKTSDTSTLATLKKVIQASYGEELRLDEIFVNTYCACPNHTDPNSSGGTGEPEGFETAVEPTSPESSEFDFENSENEFYTKTKMSLWKKGELCAFNCPENGGRARVIMEVNLYHTMTDLFGKQTVVHEKLKTRIR